MVPKLTAIRNPSVTGTKAQALVLIEFQATANSGSLPVTEGLPAAIHERVDDLPVIIALLLQAACGRTD